MTWAAQQPSASELIALWERGRELGPVERAVLLAAEGAGDEAVAALPIGRRDERVAAFARRVFGATVRMAVRCPACDEDLETDTTLGALGFGGADGGAASASVELDGKRLTARAASSADLLACAAVGDAHAARLALLARCVADEEGRPPGALSDADADALAAAVEAADPRAQVMTTPTCPACAHEWSVLFDVAAFAWDQLEDLATHLLLDVYTLADAFHWSEPDILAMTPWRRAFYLSMVTS